MLRIANLYDELAPGERRQRISLPKMWQDQTKNPEDNGKSRQI